MLSCIPKYPLAFSSSSLVFFYLCRSSSAPRSPGSCSKGVLWRRYDLLLTRRQAPPRHHTREYTVPDALLCCSRLRGRVKRPRRAEVYAGGLGRRLLSLLSPPPLSSSSLVVAINSEVPPWHNYMISCSNSRPRWRCGAPPCQEVGVADANARRRRWKPRTPRQHPPS